jgi:hypothetical protein
MQHLDDGYLQSWLDRHRSGITRAEAAEVEAHVADCEVCAARLAELEGTSERVRSLLAAAGPGGDTAPDFEDVVRRARRHAPSRGGGRGWMAAGWAASLLLATGLGWMSHNLLGPGGGDEVSTPAAEAEAEMAAATEQAAATGDQADAATEQAREAPEHGAAAPEQGHAPEQVASATEQGATEQAREATDRARAATLPLDTADAGAGVHIPPPTLADAAPTAERAREPGSLLVKGHVRGLDGRPLASALIAIPGAPIRTVTGEDGTFALSVPVDAVGAAPEHPVALTAQLLGFRSATREIDPRTADSVSVDFLLEETTVQLDEVVITGQAVRGPVVGEFRVRQSQEQVGEAREVWVPASRERAEEGAGFELLTVPDLAVLEIELGQVGGVPAVRVRQALDSGATLTLVQWPVHGPEVEPTMPGGQAVLTMERGEVRLTGAAPLEVDSLRLVLGGVR